MDIAERLEKVLKALEFFGAKKYTYLSQDFIGIKNPYSDNDMAITFTEEESVMEFTYQTAHFKSGDEDGLILHALKFLKNELCSAEFFMNGKPLFGGSREIKNNLTDAETVADWYSGGNKQVKNNLVEFFKNNDVELKCHTWNGKNDLSLKI